MTEHLSVLVQSLLPRADPVKPPQPPSMHILGKSRTQNSRALRNHCHVGKLRLWAILGPSGSALSFLWVIQTQALTDPAGLQAQRKQKQPPLCSMPSAMPARPTTQGKGA